MEPIHISEAMAYAVLSELPLTLTQAAAFLGCTVQTVKNYERRGRITKKVRGHLAGYLVEDLYNLKRHNND